MYISLKRGETLEMDCTESAGDLTGVTITSAVRFGAFYETLTVTEIDLSLGRYTLSAGTDKWPVGSLQCDIKYAINGFSSHSQSFEIIVNQQVTV